MLHDSVAEVGRRLRSAIDDLLELPDAELAGAVGDPGAAPLGSDYSPMLGGSAEREPDSEEGFAAGAALLRAHRLALLAGEAAAGDGVREGLDRLLQARPGLGLDGVGLGFRVYTAQGLGIWPPCSRSLGAPMRPLRSVLPLTW